MAAVNSGNFLHGLYSRVHGLRTPLLKVLIINCMMCLFGDCISRSAPDTPNLLGSIFLCHDRWFGRARLLPSRHAVSIETI